MGAALVLLLVALGAMAAGVLIGRYYVPDDRQLRRTARHSRAYMRALSHVLGRDHETAMAELRAVVDENVEDVEPYFALGALFRSRGEHERAIRVHQALTVRERDRRKLRHRAAYELGLDFRAAGMPRRATRAMEQVLTDEPGHEGALRALAGLYEEQARFHDAAGMWQRLGRRRGEDLSHREHHLLVAAAQAAIGREDLDAAKQLLKAAQKHEETPHFYAGAAELAAARGNHRGALERLKQALIAEPGLVPHLLPAVIAAEQGLAVHERTGHRGRRGDDLDDDTIPPRSAPLALPAASRAGDATAPGRPSAAARESTSNAPSASPAASAAIADADLVAAPALADATGSASPAQRATADATSAAVATSASPAQHSTGDAGKATGTTGTDASPTSSAAQRAGSASDGASASTSRTSSAGQRAGSASDGAGAGASPTSSAAQRAGSTLDASGASASPTSSVARGVAIAVPAPRAGVLATATPGGLVALEPEPPRPPEGVSLVPAQRPSASVVDRVLDVLDEVEAQSGPRLELSLIRAQLVPPSDLTAQAALAEELLARFPAALAARVSAARLVIAQSDAGAIRSALDGLVGDGGALAWTLRGRWQCAHCGHRPGPFSWRCAQCRRWSSLRMETGIEPPPVAPRERRAAPRPSLGVPDPSLPAATLDTGTSDAEQPGPGARRSLLGRVGGWFSGVWRRDAS